MDQRYEDEGGYYHALSLAKEELIKRGHASTAEKIDVAHLKDSKKINSQIRKRQKQESIDKTYVIAPLDIDMFKQADRRVV